MTRPRHLADAGRYGALYDALDSIQTRTNLHFLEVGAYDGNRALRLLRYWHELDPRHTSYYFGFDLWEDLTPERSKAEKSKTKLPPSQDAVWRKFRDAGRACALWGGDTRVTLPRQVEAGGLPTMDLIYIDGGHSLETVASDWAAASKLAAPGTIVLFDDYYDNCDEFGCGPLVRGLGAPWRVELLEPLDAIKPSGLRIRMARVTLPDGADYE